MSCVVTVQQVSNGLLDSSRSGIMGLGFQSLAETMAVPFWQALAASNQFTAPEFGIWLNRFINDSSATPEEQNGGALTFGGTNSSLFTGDIEFLNMPSGTTPSFWLLSVSSINVVGNSVQLGTGDAAIAAIDTGTTLIGGPSNDVRNFWAAVPGSEALTGENEGYYAYPCSTKLGVTISFGGTSWPISEADMIAQSSGDQCIGSIFDLNAGSGSGSPSWIIGAAFLKNVYSVYRAQPPSVGFAQLSANPGSSSGTSSGSTSESSSRSSSFGTTTSSTSTPTAVSGTGSGTGSGSSSSSNSGFPSGVCRSHTVGRVGPLFISVIVLGLSFLL